MLEKLLIQRAANRFDAMNANNAPEKDAPIPARHPRAHPPNIESVNVTLTNTKSNQQGSSNPSERDIYMWTNTDPAVARCFVRDVLSMKENNSIGPNLDFYWLGHVPCRSVHIVGVVVGIDITPKWTVYTIDDHTAVIECIHHYALPYMDRKEQRDRPRPPPPPPATAIGYTVDVIGKVKQYRGRRQIQAKVVLACQTTNDQWKHVKTVVDLHKTKYAIAKPFVIPTTLPNPLKRPFLEPGSPLLHNTTSKLTDFLIPGPVDPPMFRHPSQLHTADLTDETFQSYLKHYMQHGVGNVHHIEEGPLSSSPDLQSSETNRTDTPFALPGPTLTLSAFTLSHLRRVPELALLACRVTNAETRRRAQSGADATQAGPAQKSSLNARSRSSTTTPMKMKRLFMWAVIKLYEQGSIVLYDRPLSPPSDFVPVSSPMFSSRHPSSAKCVVPEEDAYLSDPPMYEEDEAYVPVTPKLLTAPVREILRGIDIKGKTPEVRAEDIVRRLQMSDHRWEHIGLQAVEQAMQLIVLD